MMRRLILFFLMHRTVVILSSIMILILGLYHGHSIKKELYPKKKSNFFTIETTYSDKSASYIEKVITIPLEEELSRIEGIREMQAQSKDGKSSIYLEFQPNKTYKRAILEIYEVLYGFSSRIPSDSHKPVLYNYDSNEKASFLYSIEIPDDLNDIQDIKDYVNNDIVNSLKKVSGVAQVQVFGGNLEELQVRIPDTFLLSDGQLISNVSKTITNNNLLIYEGYENKNDLKDYIFFGNRLKSIEDFVTLPISVGKNTATLESFANVYFREKTQDSQSLSNGKKSLSISVHINRSSSVLDVGERLAEQVETEKIKMNQQFNRDFKWKTERNEYEEINEVLSSLNSTLLMSFLVIVVFIYFSTRSFLFSGFIGGSILFCILSTLTLLSVLGYTLNVYTLVGLSIGSGLLVDNCLLVLEKLQSVEKKSYKSYTQVLQKLLKPIAISNMTTIIIFVPVFWAISFVKDILMDISLSLVLLLLFSMVFSLLFLPFFVFHLGAGVHKTSKGYEKVLSWIGDGHKLVDKHMMVNNPLGRRIFFILFGLLLVSFMFEYKYEKLKEDATDKLYLQYFFNPGVTLEEMKKSSLKFYEEVLKDYGDVKNVFISVTKYKTDYTLEVDSDVSQDLEKKMGEYNSTVKDGFLNLDKQNDKSKGISMEIYFFGRDYSKINENVLLFIQEIQKSSLIDNIYLQYRMDYKEYVLKVNRDNIAKYELTAMDVAKQLNNSRSGSIYNKFIEKEGRELVEKDVRLSGTSITDYTLETLYGSEVFDKDKHLVKTLNIVDVNEELTMSERGRKDKNKVLGLLIYAKDGVGEEELQNYLNDRIDNHNFPNLYGATVKKGELSVEEFHRFFWQYFLFVGYLLVFLIGSVYNRFKEVRYLSTVMGLTLFVWLVFMLFSRFNIDIIDVLALGLMLGLGVNNAVMVMEAVSEAKEKGVSFREILPQYNLSIWGGTFTTVFSLMIGMFEKSYIYSHISVMLFFYLILNVFYCYYFYGRKLNNQWK